MGFAPTGKRRVCTAHTPTETSTIAKNLRVKALACAGTLTTREV